MSSNRSERQKFKYVANSAEEEKSRHKQQEQADLGSDERGNQRVRTGVAFTEDLDRSGHLLLTDPFVLLSFGGRLEALPGQRAQVEIHQDITQRLQVVPSGLFCGQN